MAKKKEGWEIGQGKFSKPAKITNAPEPDDGLKGKEVAKLIYDGDDRVFRGGHKDS